jgi:hypothetical protein
MKRRMLKQNGQPSRVIYILKNPTVHAHIQMTPSICPSLPKQNIKLGSLKKRGKEAHHGQATAVIEHPEQG